MTELNEKESIGGQPADAPILIHKITPSAGFTQDSENHYIIIDLPDFRRDDIKLVVDSSGNLLISGSRKMRDKERIDFDKSFKLPENSDTKNISRKLEHEMLYITIPKLSQQEIRNIGHQKENGVEDKSSTVPSSSMEKEEEKIESKDGHDRESSDKENNGRESENPGCKIPKCIMQKIDKHKGFFLGILVFALGVIVASHTLLPPPAASNKENSEKKKVGENE